MRSTVVGLSDHDVWELMSAMNRHSFRRWMVRAVVAAGHFLVAVIVVNSRTDISAVMRASVGERIHVELLTPAPRGREERRNVPITRRMEPAPVPPTTAPGSLATQAGEAVSTQPPVDWEKEAQRIGRSASIDSQSSGRACDDSGRPGSMLPKCNRPPRAFKWNPEPKRVGFAGPLPYVRLGDRCVLGLGFFGCGVGDLPKAESHLFDDFRSPERPSSSVPSVH
jgi:hypothetical protein